MSTTSTFSSFSYFQQKQIAQTNLSILFHSSLIGVWRGLIGLPFQHPFDNIKTNMQAFQSNFMNTFNKIYQKKGILGFYSGFIVNSMRIVSKQIYRWPLQLGLFGFYSKLYGIDNANISINNKRNENSQRNNVNNKDLTSNHNKQNDRPKITRGQLGIICGINMALFQVMIICPFQRLKVWLMTAQKNEKIREFFKICNRKSFFDGIGPVFFKQMISWMTYLGATEYFKDKAYTYSNKNRYEDQLNNLEIISVSTCVALINTLFVMPFDCIKTHYQQNKIKIEANDMKKAKGFDKFTHIIQQIMKKNGWRGFFKGWQIKLVQYSINSLFTVVLFQKLQKQYQQNRSLEL